MAHNSSNSFPNDLKLRFGSIICLVVWRKTLLQGSGQNVSFLNQLKQELLPRNSKLQYFPSIFPKISSNLSHCRTLCAFSQTRVTVNDLMSARGALNFSHFFDGALIGERLLLERGAYFEIRENRNLNFSYAFKIKYHPSMFEK